MNIPLYILLPLIILVLEPPLLYLSIHLENKKRNANNGQLLYEKPTIVPYEYLFILVLYVCLFALILYSGFQSENGKLPGKFIPYQLYALIFFLAFPFLKKRCSARIFDGLFFIPTTTLLFRSYAYYDPLIEIPIYTIDRGNTIFYIWILGMAVVFLWYIGSHLCFRRYILKEAIHIVDPKIINLWVNELEEHGTTAECCYPIVYSRKINTPLTIGLFQKVYTLSCHIAPIPKKNSP